VRGRGQLGRARGPAPRLRSRPQRRAGDLRVPGDGRGSRSRSTGTSAARDFWKHCVAVACCAELLADAAGAKQTNPPRRSSAACCTTWARSRSTPSCRRASAGSVEAGGPCSAGNIADLEARSSASTHGGRQAPRREVAAPASDPRLGLAARPAPAGACPRA
jgi:hypothetical protein